MRKLFKDSGEKFLEEKSHDSNYIHKCTNAKHLSFCEILSHQPYKV